MIKLSRYIIFITILSLGSQASAANLQKSSSKLHYIISKIHKLEGYISLKKSQKTNLQHLLKQTEVRRGKMTRKLKVIRKQLSTENKTLKQHQMKQKKYQIKLTQQKKLLIEQMTAIYKLGAQPFLKVILNQENPEQINRYLYYYNSINQALLNLIKKTKQTRDLIKENTEKIKHHNQRLQNIHIHVLQKQHELFKEQVTRKKLVNQIEKSIQNKAQQLKELKKNAEHLHTLIKNLKEHQVYTYHYGKSFNHMKRVLPWPVLKGHVIQNFGQKIEGSDFHSSGILIRAIPGSEVHAIAPGKILYANWLKGFGLLVIIQHNYGYMSLYGRNQTLYVKTNQYVKGGDVIATIGNSGGFSKTALYFEIRHNGKPINPIKWLKNNH